MGNVSDYCTTCGNLKEDCTCARGGGPWFNYSNDKKLSYEESENVRKKYLNGKCE